jgi:hypothetical protein
MSRAWYQFALASPSAPASVTLVEAQGDHLGEALALVVKAHARCAVLAARLSPAAPLGDSVGKSRLVVEHGPAAEVAAGPFRWPPGVLPEMSALGRLVAARAGYTVHRTGELVILEAQVESDQLGDVFLGLVEGLPVADNLEVQVMHHFEDHGTTEVWLTPRIGVKQVLRFLDEHDLDLLESGCVELAVYLRQERSTLRLTEHKTVLWTSVDRSTEGRVAQALRKLGVPEASEPILIASVPHFHTRPHGSRDRAALGRHLQRQRMRLVDRMDRLGVSLPKAGTPGA